MTGSQILPHVLNSEVGMRKRFQVWQGGQQEIEEAYRHMWAAQQKMGDDATVCGLSPRAWLDELAAVAGPTANVVVTDEDAGSPTIPRYVGLLRAELGGWPGLFGVERVVYVRDVWIAERVVAARAVLRRSFRDLLVGFMAANGANAAWANVTTPAAMRLWRRWGFEAGPMVMTSRLMLSGHDNQDMKGNGRDDG